jgi:hypothetical protein
MIRKNLGYNVQLEINSEYAHNEEAGVTEEGYEIASILTYGLTDSADLVLTA